MADSQERLPYVTTASVPSSAFGRRIRRGAVFVRNPNASALLMRRRRCPCCLLTPTSPTDTDAHVIRSKCPSAPGPHHRLLGRGRRTTALALLTMLSSGIHAGPAYAAVRQSTLDKTWIKHAVLVRRCEIRGVMELAWSGPVSYPRAVHEVYHAISTVFDPSLYHKLSQISEPLKPLKRRPYSSIKYLGYLMY